MPPDLVHPILRSRQRHAINPPHDVVLFAVVSFLRLVQQDQIGELRAEMETLKEAVDSLRRDWAH